MGSHYRGIQLGEGHLGCISMLKGSGVGLVVVGRGSDDDLHALREHAKVRGEPLGLQQLRP